MDVAQRLEQGCSLYGDLHRIIPDFTPAAALPKKRIGTRAASFDRSVVPATRPALSRGARTLPRRRGMRKSDRAAVPMDSTEFLSIAFKGSATLTGP
jgi:hypothetical protein